MCALIICKCVTFTVATELEKINEDIDPFANMEILSDDMEGSDDSGSDDRSDAMGSDDDDHSNTDHNSDTGANTEDTLAYDILLDSAANSEAEDVGLSPEDTDSAGEDTDSDGESIDAQDEDDEHEDGDGDGEGDSEGDGEESGESSCGFIVPPGVVPPQPICRAADQQSSPYTAGCVWTEDWSCPYDAVFMVFWTLYKQSSASWRDGWARHAPVWNRPLKNNFDHLIILGDTPGVQDHATWFSRYRDRFRDQLSRADLKRFPRRGPVPTSVGWILEVMFGSTAEPHLEQHLICGDCGALSQTEREIRYLATNFGRGDNTPVWLHTVWTEFVNDSKTIVARSRARCSHCQGPNRVRDLKMPGTPWIWFERGPRSPVWPSLTLTFDSQPQRLDYSLRAIIYSGGRHFSVRFRAKSGEWWRHDGLVASGVPEPDNIHSEANLLMNGSRFASMLIYRRDGC